MFLLSNSILIISAVFPPEPVVSSRLSHDIAVELSKKNNNVTVLCPKPSRPHGYKFNENIKEFKFNIIRQNSFICPSSNFLGRIIESLSFGIHCSKFIKSNSKFVKVIYINSWPLISQFLIVRIAKKYNIPCIIHIQDIYPESLINKLPIAKSFVYKFLFPIDKYVLKNANLVIAISNKMKEILVTTRNLNSEKVIVVYNWQNELDFISLRESIPAENNTVSKKINFMYLGNNGPVAGIDFIINSFVKANIINSKLIIAGSGSNTKACIKLVSDLNVNNIEFISVGDGMVPVIQAKADVLILPVRKNAAFSSIPSKLPAYMFSSKPIIGCLDLESDTAQAIIDSKCGIVVESENEVELVKALIRSSKWSESERILRGNLGYKYAIQNFSKQPNLSSIVNEISKYCDNC